MPLLRKRPFEKSTAWEYLNDDDEVFHCEITDEVFTDYEEYFARIMLVYTRVWSCKITGKKNLIYSEAQRSERKAWWALKRLPRELRLPIVYLARRSRRRRRVTDRREMDLY